MRATATGRAGEDSLKNALEVRARGIAVLLLDAPYNRDMVPELGGAVVHGTKFANNYTVWRKKRRSTIERYGRLGEKRLEKILQALNKAKNDGNGTAADKDVLMLKNNGDRLLFNN